MSEILRLLWTYEIQVLPVALAMLAVEIPTAIRRRQQFFYVPIYFSVFPLSELNSDLAHYLGEDYWVGGDPDEDVAESLRRKILASSVISITLSALLIPVFAGFVSGFFLAATILPQFILVFLAYKLSGIIRSIVDFPNHAIGNRRNTILLVAIYMGYLGVASRMIAKAHGLARPFVVERDWIGLFVSVSDLVFSRVLVEFLLLTVITAVFTTFIMDRRVREENVKHVRSHR